jgi:hypothetical protein
MVPVPSNELVDVVVDVLLVTAGAVTLVEVDGTVVVVEVDGTVVVVEVDGTVVVVVEDCAKAVVSAIALTAPAANNVVNLFCFMFVLCFG